MLSFRPTSFQQSAPITLILALMVQALFGYTQQTSPESLYNDAVKAYDSGDAPQAIKLYQEFIKKHPTSVRARTNLGVALVHEGRYGEAILQYKEALKVDPKSPTVQLDLALAWYKQADFAKAASELVALQRRQPENQQTLYLLVDCYLRLGRYKDVVGMLGPLYKANPADPRVDYALGTALIEDGQTQRGQAVIEQILKNGHTTEAALLSGASQYSSGNFKTAAITIRGALETNPDLPGGWTLLGKTSMSSGDNDAAKSAFHHALANDPNDFDANLYLGGILRHDGENEAAAPYLNRALTLRSDSPTARFQVGALNLANGKLEKARQQLEAVARQMPDFLEVHVQLASLYAKLNRPQDSERERKIVLALNEKARREGPRPER